MEYAIITGIILVIVLNVAVLIKLKITKSVTVLVFIKHKRNYRSVKIFDVQFVAFSARKTQSDER